MFSILMRFRWRYIVTSKIIWFLLFESVFSFLIMIKKKLSLKQLQKLVGKPKTQGRKGTRDLLLRWCYFWSFESLKEDKGEDWWVLLPWTLRAKLKQPVGVQDINLMTGRNRSRVMIYKVAWCTNHRCLA